MGRWLGVFGFAMLVGCSGHMTRGGGHEQAGGSCGEGEDGQLSCDGVPPVQPDERPSAGGSGFASSDQPYAGTLSTAGSAATQPSAGSSSGGLPGKPVVACQSGFQTGREPAGSSTLCAGGRLGCRDGHDYTWACFGEAPFGYQCSCFEDNEQVAAFDPGFICPQMEQVNAGCGWNLEIW